MLPSVAGFQGAKIQLFVDLSTISLTISIYNCSPLSSLIYSSNVIVVCLSSVFSFLVFLGITYCISFSRISKRSFGSRVFRSLSICRRFLSITLASHTLISCVTLFGFPFGRPLGFPVCPFGCAISSHFECKTMFFSLVACLQYLITLTTYYIGNLVFHYLAYLATSAMAFSSSSIRLPCCSIGVCNTLLRSFLSLV